VANNDATISVFSLPDLQREKVIGPFPDAVNSCKMSPDGKHLAVVGDFPQVFLVEITENDFMTPVPLLPAPGTALSAVVAGSLSRVVDDEDESKVHQYATWSLSSTLLAVSSDTHNYVTLWHVPSKSVVARIDSGDWSFPIQFSMIKEELLTFANRRGFLHFVNVNTFARQVIAVPSFAKINGFCFSRDFRTLFVG